MKNIPIIRRLNEEWHEIALYIYTAIVVAHWAEHLSQAFQIWVLGWPRPQAGGVLGLFFPVLVSSEWLHYAYAIVMLIGFIILRPGFGGRSRVWWDIALWLQVWHHFEHALLFSQALGDFTLFNSPVRTSIAQLFFPRVELHLFYNVVVFVPMIIAMYYHLVPPKGEKFSCSCAHYVIRFEEGKVLPRYIRQPKNI